MEVLARHKSKGILLGWFENVPGLATPPLDEFGERLPESRSNLAVGMGMLDSAGFFSCATLLDPRAFAHPVSRQRLWIPFVAKSLLEDLNVSEANMYQGINHFTHVFAMGHGMAVVDDFFLKDDDPALRSMLEVPAIPTRSRPQPGDGGGRWELKHLQHSIRNGTEWWHSSIADADMKAKHPGVCALTKRELDVLSQLGVAIGDPAASDHHANIVDTSQSLSQTRKFLAGGGMFCLTPGMRAWVTVKNRFLHGIEAMYMQGICFPPAQQQLLHDRKHFTSEELTNLAGNAFHTGCCACSILTLLTTLATAQQPRPPAGSPGEGFDEEADDAESILSSIWPV